jgi:hypothetical protein
MSIDFSIDWRKYFERVLPPYLEKKGGFICVHGNENSGLKIFTDQINSRILPRSSPILRVTSPTTSRTQHEVLKYFEERLNIVSPSLSDIHIANDIKAQNVNISHIDVRVSENSEKNIQSRQKKLTKHILELLSHTRVAILLNRCDEMPDPTVRWFWNEFLHDYIRKMTDNGLLLICTCQSGDRKCIPREHNFQPDVPIRLQDRYGENESKYAAEDIVKILVKRANKKSEDALAQAEMLLLCSERKPSSVHAGLAAFFAEGML